VVNVYLQGHGTTNTTESSFAHTRLFTTWARWVFVSVTCFMEKPH